MCRPTGSRSPRSFLIVLKPAVFRAPAAALLLGLALAHTASATVPPVWGPMPEIVRHAALSGAFAFPATSGPLPPPGTQTVWRIPVVLVSFSDSALVYTAQDFNATLFDTTGASPQGSIYDYYQWVSGGRIRVIPTIVAKITAPNTRAFYGNQTWGLDREETPNNDYGLVKDALNKCAAAVDWSPFDGNHDGVVDMLWVVHAGVGGEATIDRNNLWSIASLMTAYWLASQPYETQTPIGGGSSAHIMIDRFSILPELSAFSRGHLSEIGVYCHEFGHALGLPDLYDTQTNGYPDVGPGNWSLMSTGVYGGDGISPQYPARPGAWCEQYLGWKTAITPASDTTVTLAPVEHGGSVVQLSFQGEPGLDHYLIENRRRENYDRTIPSDGLLLYRIIDAGVAQRLAINAVNAGPNPAITLVEGDGLRDLLDGTNRGDAGDPFPGASSRELIWDYGPGSTLRDLAGGVTNLAMFGFTPTDTSGGLRVGVQVRAPGWQPVRDATDPTFAPIAAFGTARRLVLDGAGDLFTVGSESQAGHAQVVLRSRINEVWMPPITLSASSGDAQDPTIALLPGGDLAVVWSDTRDGHAHLFYRGRILGSWGAEQRLAAPPGESLNPAAGADARGGVEVTWLNITPGGAQEVVFTRFTYLSPFGQVLPVSAAGSRTSAPSIEVRPDGAAIVLWIDQGSSPQQIQFAHFHPDSGFSIPNRLVDPSGLQPLAVQAAIDGAGTMHAIWVMAGPGTNELHYQRRLSGMPAYPPDTTLYSVGGTVQGPRLIVDSQGTAHITFQADVSGVGQIRYKRWLPAYGWDIGATQITLPGDPTASRPLLAARGPADVTVLYTSYLAGLPHFLERRRLFDVSPSLSAVPAPPPRARVARLTLAPNPVRPGDAIAIRYAGAGTNLRVEIFDLAGRRIWSQALAGSAPRLGATLAPDVTRAWPGGVYFARVTGDLGPAARIVVLR